MWSKTEALNMARNKDITNARVCRVKGIETLRGKDIPLKSLPSISVKDSLDETTPNPIKDKIWYQQAVQQIMNQDAVKISINMGESIIPSYNDGHIVYKAVEPYKITVADYDVTGQYECEPSLIEFVNKADMIKILVPLISTVIDIFKTINQREAYKSYGLRIRNPYGRDTTWKINCLNGCDYTLNFARIWSCGDCTLISADNIIKTCDWVYEEKLLNSLNTLQSYIRFPKKNVCDSMSLLIEMYKHSQDDLYSIYIVWHAIDVKQKDGVYHIDNECTACTYSDRFTMENLIYWLKTEATQLVVNAFYEAEDKLLEGRKENNN